MSGDRVNIGGVELDVRADGTLLIADLKKAEQQAKTFASQTSSAIERGIGGALNSIRNQLIGVFSVQQLANFTRDSVKTLADFGQAISTLKAVSGATDVQLRALSNAAEDLGATTRFSATEAADAMILLAQAGFSADEVLQATSGTLALAQAGGLGLAQAADVASSTLRGFNLNVSETGRVMDVLAMAANASNADVGSLGEALKFAAPTAAAFNLSLEETVAVIGKLSDAGLKGGMAGRGFQSFVTAFVQNDEKIRALIGNFNLADEGISAIVRRLVDAGITTKQVTEIFRAENLDTFTIIKNASVGAASGIDTLRGALQNSAGEAERVAKIMDENLNGAILGASSALEALVLSVGEAGATEFLIEVFKGLSAALSSAAQSVTDFTSTAIEQAETAAAKLAVVNQAVLDDTAQLEIAQEDLRKAIEGQGEAAIATARLEVDAINTRILKNKELAGTYAIIARAKLAEAEEQLAQSKRPGGELDRLLYNAPQFFREDEYTAGGRDPVTGKLLAPEKRTGVFQVSPSMDIGSMSLAGEGSLLSNELINRAREQFGGQDAQMQMAMAVIESMQARGLPLQEGSRALLEWVRKNQENLVTVEAVRKSLDIYESGGVAPAPQTSPGAPGVGSGAGGNSSGDATKLQLYTTALQDYNATIKEIAATEDSRATKSRAALKAVLDYNKAHSEDEALLDYQERLRDIAAQELSDDERQKAELAAWYDYQDALGRVAATMRLIADLSDRGILSDKDAARARDIITAADAEDAPVLPVDDAEIDQAMQAEWDQAYIDATGHDPNRPVTRKQERDYRRTNGEEVDSFEGYEEDLKGHTKRAIYDAISDGDVGQAFEDSLADAASNGLARAVDQFVELLWDIPWDKIFSDAFGDEGWASTLIKGVGSFFGAPTSHSSGGDVMAGRPVRMNELGEEIFYPKVDGFIIPNRSGARASDATRMASVSFGDTILQVGKMGSDVSLEDIDQRLEAHRNASAELVDNRIRDQMRRGAYD